jgi:hypothetical protein
VAIYEVGSAISASAWARVHPSRVPATNVFTTQTANAPVIVYDTEMSPVADLQNATSIGYALRFNEIGTASFELPADDSKNEYCLERSFVDIFDGDRNIGMFRIIRIKTRHSSAGKMIHYNCEHVLGTLLDDRMIGIRNPTGLATEDVLEYVLSQQGTVHWVLGTNDFDRNFWYLWDNARLLEALFEIPKRYYATYQ